MDTAPEPAAAAAPLYREHIHPADAVRVKALPVAELTILYDALTAASDAIIGVQMRPRCDVDSDVNGWLESEVERLSDLRSYAIEELSRRPPSGNRLDDDQRIGYVAAWDLKECGAGVLETIAKLVRMKDEADLAQHQAAPRAGR